MILKDERGKEKSESGALFDQDIPDSNEEEIKDLFSPSSNIILANCCKVNTTIYFGQLPPLELPEERQDTGGLVYTGETAYGKQMAPMWIVTSYRLAIN